MHTPSKVPTTFTAKVGKLFRYWILNSHPWSSWNMIVLDRDHRCRDAITWWFWFSYASILSMAISSISSIPHNADIYLI
jgi:hypothetical protein